MSDLDRAWYSINALGGALDDWDDFNKGYDLALRQSLQIIERLGGKDPLVRAASPVMRGEDCLPDRVLPLAHGRVIGLRGDGPEEAA